MERVAVTNLLILAREAKTARQWAEILSTPQTRVWSDGAQLPPDTPVDLIVTDCQSEDIPGTGDEEAWGAATPAVVAVGVQRPAEVSLPADATPRELQLACRLVAEVVHLRRIVRDHSGRHERLLQESRTDPLTGLPNRRAWDEALDALCYPPRTDTAAAAAPQPACLAILDLDHFKRVNDSHGHLLGDRVLRAAGRRVQANLRQGDMVARLGGDEFALLLDVSDPASAVAIVDRVRRAIAAGLAEDGLPAVTASAGLALAFGAPPCPALPCPDALLAAADAALRQAKSQGRDRTVMK
jgi:diguanylate cyclase (GGDEF)-like protein